MWVHGREGWHGVERVGNRRVGKQVGRELSDGRATGYRIQFSARAIRNPMFTSRRVVACRAAERLCSVLPVKEPPRKT